MQFSFLYPVSTRDHRNKIIHVCDLAIVATAHVRQQSTFFNAVNFKPVRIEINSIKMQGKQDELLPLIDALTFGELAEIEDAALTNYRDVASIPETTTEPA